MTRRPRSCPRWTATLAGVLATSLLLLLVQVPRQGVAMLAAETAQAVMDGSLCVHDGGEGQPSNTPEARHDHTPCLACQVCCAVPATLQASDPELPRPWRWRACRSNPSIPLPRRQPRGFRPNARAPPGRLLSLPPHRREHPAGGIAGPWRDPS